MHSHSLEANCRITYQEITQVLGNHNIHYRMFAQSTTDLNSKGSSHPALHF